MRAIPDLAERATAAIDEIAPQGYLNPEQARKFVELVVEDSRFHPTPPLVAELRSAIERGVYRGRRKFAKARRRLRRAEIAAGILRPMHGGAVQLAHLGRMGPS